MMPAPARFDARLRLSLSVATVVMVLAGGFLLGLNLLEPTDWDMTHEFYFGQRLFSGELLWTREFHDKLPFVQFLIAIPARLQSLLMFQLATLAAVAAGAASLLYLPRTVGNDTYPVGLCRRVRVFAAILFACVLVTLQGRMFNLLTSSTALALLVTVLLLRDADSGQPTPLRRLLWASLCAAAAISMRPYHIAPLAVAVAWAGVACAANLPAGTGLGARLRCAARVALPWGVAIGVWGFVLNILPYVVTRQLPAFVEGLRMVAAGNLPKNGIAGFIGWMADVKILMLWAILLPVGGLALLAFRRGGKLEGRVVMALLAVVALVLIILQTHSWAGYNQMFGGLLALLVVLLLERVIAGEARPWLDAPLRWAMLAMPPAFALLFGAYAALMAARTVAHGLPEPVPAERLAAFRDYLQRTHQEGVPFLAPGDMELHWRMDEPRRGFPHASHTGHIFTGWWVGVQPHRFFETPATPAAYCDLLEHRGPILLVDPAADSGLACLTGPHPAYRLDAALPYGKGGLMTVYVREAR